jgi:hypothetical protein
VTSLPSVGHVLGTSALNPGLLFRWRVALPLLRPLPRQIHAPKSQQPQSSGEYSGWLRQNSFQERVDLGPDNENDEDPPL